MTAIRRPASGAPAQTTPTSVPSTRVGFARESVPDRTLASRNNQAEPQLPHERDQSSQTQAPVNTDAKQVGEQAARDIERGLVDTSLSPVMQKIDAAHFSTPTQRKKPDH